MRNENGGSVGGFEVGEMNNCIWHGNIIPFGRKAREIKGLRVRA